MASGSGFIISEISERNSNYSIRSSEQTGNVAILDWITNTNHDYAASRKTMRQYGSRKVNHLEKIYINFESNYVTLLIDRG